MRHHGFEGGRTTHRISDSLSRGDFRRTALYADYYQRVGLDHVIAVPLLVDARTLVSIVLNRAESISASGTGSGWNCCARIWLSCTGRPARLARVALPP